MKTTLTKSGKEIMIDFDYNPMLVSAVKALDGREYSPTVRAWFIPITNSLESLERLSSLGFDIPENVWLAARKDEEVSRQAEKMSEQGDVEFSSTLPLFPYQKVGARFIAELGSGLIGDEMGLGKTIQALAVCEYAGDKKVLIFTPSAVKWQWAQEIEPGMARY